LINEEAAIIYPIKDYITTLLSFKDVDTHHILPILDEIAIYSPDAYKDYVINTIEMTKAQEGSEEGKWNREEMKYYDKEVDSAEKRIKMLESIKNENFHQIFLPRKIITNEASKYHNITFLEVGCGNSRTISKIFDPFEHNYNYIGVDISWARLLVAKCAINVGTFIQASALSLPFKDNSFSVIVGFGVFHHLIDPVYGIKQALSKVEDGGMLGFHEPILKPQTVLNPDKHKFFLNLLQEYVHSDHDNELDMKRLVKEIDRKVYIFKIRYYYGTILRTILNFIFLKFNYFSKNLLFNKLILKLDKLFYNSFCKKPNRFGPGAVIAIIEKNSS